jgi:hypothetical protein
MLKIENEHLSLELPEGWRPHPEQDSLEALHFVLPDVARELIVDGVGLRACESLEVLRAELKRISRQKQIELLERRRALCGGIVETQKGGEVEVSFSSRFPQGAHVQKLLTTTAPQQGAHIVLLVSLSEMSAAASVESVEGELGRLMEGLIYLPNRY